MTRTLSLAAQQASTGSELAMFDIVHKGGVVGYIIIALSLLSLALAGAYALRFRTSAILPKDLEQTLRSHLQTGDITSARRVCSDTANACALTQILGAGLKRLESSPFGALELRSALEEAGQDRVARLVRSTDALALMASIAPMLGLLGTVIGINGAFSTIADSEGFARPDQLAGDISLALITTIMGLSLAIPATAAVTFFRNKIERLGGDLGASLDDMATLLENARSGKPQRVVQRSGGPQPAAVAPAPQGASGSARPSSPSRPDTPGGSA